MSEDKHYTGVGSRETPEEILAFMEKVGQRMDELGYVGRSGSADGADLAFEKGFLKSRKSFFEAYLPWKGFNNKCDEIHIVAPYLDNYEEAVEIASKIHPVFDRLSRGAKALHTRNVYQVLGKDLKTPSKVLFCYAQPTKNGVKGGTNTAVQLAIQHGIRVYNFYLKEDIEEVCNKLRITYD